MSGHRNSYGSGGGSGNRDEYRSRPGPEPWRRPHSPRRDSYDSHRDSYNPRPPPPPHSFNGYREHRPPQGDFTFRMPNPSGIAPGPDSYRPDQDYSRSRRQGHGGRGRGRGHPFRGRGGYPRRIPAERELLRKEQGKVQENLVAGHSAQYRDLADLSDDEEAAMEISDESDNDNGDDGEPSRKRIRRNGPSLGDSSAVGMDMGLYSFTGPDDAATEYGISGAVDESSAGGPKWSNPDAETALPPESAQKKKKDMVQLIRKARLDDQSAAKLTASTEAEDFISFDDFGDEEGAQDPPKSFPPPSKENNHNRNVDAPSRPALPQPPPPPPRTAPSSDPLGSRKRTFDDRIKPPAYGPLKKVNKMPGEGQVSPEWEPVDGEESCPWIINGNDHSDTSNMNMRLHKEICDFYHYACPQPFEQRMRAELVDKLKDALRRNQKYKGCQVRPFGSFMSGLYLPTADMDLVICSKDWLDRGMSAFPSANSLHKFKAFLINSKLADPSSTEVISRAKVPLVKYIDRLTGLRVDVSFDRMDGPAAIETFLGWKEKYPALPVLVLIIKHFLVMRGLSEPVNGGIGSFSVSCMVMNMLQQAPESPGRNTRPENHLDEMLLEFFDLYGNKFDYKDNAIRINPPGYVPKNSRAHNLTYRNTGRLSIIDPNNSSNDIAGGSSNIEVILQDFRSAHRMMHERMGELSEKKPGSILETILAGNYSSFRLQRAHLRRLYEKQIGPYDD